MVQCLMLKILAEMSSDVIENGVETRDAKRIRSALMEHRIADKLFDLFKSNEFYAKEENVKYALILIRNLSLAGRLSSHSIRVYPMSVETENCSRVLILKFPAAFNVNTCFVVGFL